MCFDYYNYVRNGLQHPRFPPNETRKSTTFSTRRRTKMKNNNDASELHGSMVHKIAILKDLPRSRAARSRPGPRPMARLMVSMKSRSAGNNALG